MEKATSEPTVINLGYVLGIRSKNKEEYFSHEYRNYLSTYHPDRVPEDWFSPLLAAHRYPSMRYLRAELCNGMYDLFSEYATQTCNPVVSRLKQSIFEPSEKDKRDDRHLGSDELVVAQFELALQPANPSFVELILDYRKATGAGWQMDYPEDGLHIKRDVYEAFVDSIHEPPPEGFEKAGYLVVNRESLNTKMPKYISSILPNIRRPGNDYYEFEINNPQDRMSRSLSLSSYNSNAHLGVVGQEYASLLSTPDTKAQVMRADIRLTPLIPAHAGLIYEYENMIKEDKHMLAGPYHRQSVDPQERIESVLRLNRHLHQMPRQHQAALVKLRA